jgi:pimeloyl-ACP methyl ester carboxylesterase
MIRKRPDMNGFPLRFVRTPHPGVPDHYLHIPPGCSPAALARLPVLVMVHGISRNAAEQALRASQNGLDDMVIVAPLFERRSMGRYQQLAPGSIGLPADAALINLLDWLAGEGFATGRIHLFGFSGGAQFAHRFTLMHPQRVARLCVAAAGWYTMPDPAMQWPAGLAATPQPADLPGLLAVPTLVIVGRGDNLRTGSLNQSPAIDRQQGPHRVARARNWTRALQATARRLGLPPAARLQIVPASRHQFEAYASQGRMFDHLAAWLRGGAATKSTGSGLICRRAAIRLDGNPQVQATASARRGQDQREHVHA